MPGTARLAILLYKMFFSGICVFIFMFPFSLRQGLKSSSVPLMVKLPFSFSRALGE